MRILIGLLLLAAVIGGFLKHSRREQPAQIASAPASPATPQPAAAPREPSQHNWAKRAINRTEDVKRQVAQQVKENEE